MGEIKETATGAAQTAPAPEQSVEEVHQDMPSPKRTTAPAFQFYPKDFLTSPRVMNMTATERGMYITLLCVCWLEGGLPNDVKQLANLVRVPLKQFAKAWPHNLQGCFTPVRNARLINQRLEAERQKQIAYREKQAQFGKKGADVRKGSLKGSPRVAKAGAAKGRASSSSSVSNLQSPKETVPAEQGTAHPIKAFLTLYEALFADLSADKPNVTKRDAGIAKGVIGKYGEAKAADLLRAFFASPDPFIQNSGYGLNVFAGQINKLLVAGRATPTLTTAKTAGNMSVLQRFVERGTERGKSA